MLQAQIRGKLRALQENQEDLLTSNAFGILTYFGHQLFWQFASLAADVDGQTLADSIGHDAAVSDVEFWPRLSTPDSVQAEPDVTFAATTPDGSRWFVLVEAKYRSPISSEADPGSAKPEHQLSREWLCALASERARAVVIYLTSDYVRPQDDIEEAQAELRQKGQGKGAFFWLSWRDLAKCLETEQAQPIVDLRKLLLQRYGLSYYLGIGELAAPPLWRYIAKWWTWIAEARPTGWRFTP
jgi:hypothetical protein